jgi:hypothetical protein
VLGGFGFGLLAGVVGWSVDPDGVGEIEHLRCRGDVTEPMRMPGPGLGEHGAPVGGLGGCQAEVDVGGRVQADADVSMFVVVPLGELVHEFPCLRQ